MQIKKTNKLSTLLNCFLLTILSFNLSSQDADFDQAFLESLPDEVREDVLQEVKSQQNQEESQKYKRSPSSKLSKSMLVKKWNAFLEQTDSELGSQRFGIDFFRSLQTSFMPINEPNFDPNYIVDYGDVLEIQFIGPDPRIDEIDIKRDGSISIKNIGKIFVGGLTLNTAEELISQKVNETMIGTKALVSLTTMRDIQVLISGFSYSPGVYTLNGGSNILHALNVSGGIKEEGSLRNIQINRNGVVIHTIDLYDYFISGDLSKTVKLRSGDSISIQPAEVLVYVEGGVRRPSLYEIKKGETLADVISFAQGFSESADLDDISFQYFKNGNLVSEIVDSKKLKEYSISSKSGLYISEFILNQVKISGAVKREGTYVISDNETLSSLIKRAGGYKENAYLLGGILLNENARVLEAENQKKMYGDLIRYIASNLGSVRSANTSNAGQSQSLGIILEELKNYEPVGRIQAEFDLNKIEQDQMLDTTLNNMDEIIIPKITQQVFVLGEVGSSGAVRYMPNSKVSEYISYAGGLTQYSDNSQIYVVSPSGKAELYKAGIFGSNQILIYPGSVIYVPRDVASVEGIALAAVLTPILSNMALAIASINSISNN